MNTRVNINKKRNIVIVILLITAIIIIAIVSMNIGHAGTNKKIINNTSKSERSSTLTSTNGNTKKIFNTITSESSYKSDPTKMESLLDGEFRYIIKAKVVEIQDAEFIPPTSLYNNPYMPCTPIRIKISQTIYGDNINPKDDIIYMSGGDISLDQLCKRLDETDIERLGINKLNDTEKKINYMRYKTEYSYQVEQGQEYIFVVGKIGDNMYKIVDEGCGIFTEAQGGADNTKIKNVLNNKVLSTKDLKI